MGRIHRSQRRASVSSPQWRHGLNDLDGAAAQGAHSSGDAVDVAATQLSNQAAIQLSRRPGAPAPAPTSARSSWGPMDMSATLDGEGMGHSGGGVIARDALGGGGGGGEGGDPGQIFNAGASGAGAPVPFRGEMEASFGRDFSGVRAHLGTTAARSATDSLDANAATYGDTILFRDASPDKSLVAHELTHVAQQGSGRPQAKARLGTPNDASERQAESVAQQVMAGESVSVGPVAPAIRRDIKGSTPKVPLGEFAIDMKKQESPGVSASEKGTVSFKPSEKSPDTKDIRLDQIVKTTVLSTGKDADWSTINATSAPGVGEEADRNKMMTADSAETHTTRKGDTLSKIAQKHYGDPDRHGEIYKANTAILKSAEPDKAIEAGLALTIPNAVKGGFFIDHMASDSRATPRTNSTDDEVPSDYVWPGEETTPWSVAMARTNSSAAPARISSTAGRATIGSTAATATTSSPVAMATTVSTVARATTFSMAARATTT